MGWGPCPLLLGMVANLRPSEQLNFVGLLYCMGQGDGGGAADHVLSFSHQQTCVGPQEVAAFRSAMAALFAESCRGYGTGIDLARVLRGVLGLVRRCAHHCPCVFKGGVARRAQRNSACYGGAASEPSMNLNPKRVFQAASLSRALAFRGAML